MNFANVILQSPAPGEKTALLTQQGDLRYDELRTSVPDLAATLRARGLQPGQRVLLAGESSIFWVQCYLAIALAGGVAVPVAVPADPEYLARLVRETEPLLACVQAKWLKRLADALPGIDVVLSDARPPRLPGDLEIITPDQWGSGQGFHIHDTGDDELAAIMYTSGSTAEPRGVMVSHGNILANSADIIASLDIGPDDRIMAVLPFHYCFGTSLLHTHLLAGASLVIDNRFLFPEKVLQNMVESRCTSLAGVPSTYQILLRRSSLKKMEFPDLKKVQQAGGKLADNFIAELEEALPGVDVYIMYGQTEATARLSCISPADRRAHPGSIGRGLRNVHLEIRDEEGRVLPAGEVGEIVATRPNITLGYWRNEEATERVFGGGLHTGDLARRDADGYVYITDRARDFLKCGGKRVGCRHIEEAILLMEGMAECAVVGVPDMVLGEAVCIYAVHARGSAAEADLRAYCEKNLDRTLHPRRIVFLDDLPRNKSGKPDKPALKRRAAEEVAEEE